MCIRDRGTYTTAAAADTGALGKLTTDDIGKTLDYTVTWKDSSGKEQSTTVSLTYQGDGTGAVAKDNKLSLIHIWEMLL